MQVPILKQGSYLIASIQSALTDADLVQLRESLVEQVGRYRSRGVIVDVTALDVMDSFASRILRDIATMIKLRGAETVIVGIDPDVALAMVRLGPEPGGCRDQPRPRGGPRVPRGAHQVREAAVTEPASAPDVRVPVASDIDIVAARQQGRALATRLGFSSSDATMVATAISELARNIVLYAKRGEIILARGREQRAPRPRHHGVRRW